MTASSDDQSQVSNSAGHQTANAPFPPPPYIGPEGQTSGASPCPEGQIPSNIAVIAVMGATGTGKTTFVNLVSGSNLGVGESLESCTKSLISTDVFECQGYAVQLVDTPGFDDDEMNDTEVLELIAAFLSETYKKGMKLAGIIYMHRISDRRMGGIARRNFRLFRDLCGDSMLRNVVIVTNMWDDVPQAIGEAREAELRTNEKCFKPALDEGARLVRHHGTDDSARAVLQQILGNRPAVMQIQHELVDERLPYTETSACVTLRQDIQARVEKHKTAAQDRTRGATKADDDDTKRQLEEESGELRRKVEMLERRLAEQQENFEKRTHLVRRLLEEGQRKARSRCRRYSHCCYLSICGLFVLGPVAIPILAEVAPWMAPLGITSAVISLVGTYAPKIRNAALGIGRARSS